jgi:pimeloyl-ACP methyl ester carboxylesterase
MKLTLTSICFAICLTIGCASQHKINNDEPTTSFENFKLDTAKLFDNKRNRVIPIATYTPKIKQKLQKELVILSHGYGANKGGDYLAYSYIATFLANNGFIVLSIQHELPTDSLLPLTGIPQIVRRSNWERGVENILFVLNNFKQNNQHLKFENVSLIGHSNGGDMSMLFAEKYPNLINKVISLDNRRVALPRTTQPKVYSLRSSDMPADVGVLPTLQEQEQYKIIIVNLPNTIHNDMDDGANTAQRKEINSYLLSFLREK